MEHSSSGVRGADEPTALALVAYLVEKLGGHVEVPHDVLWRIEGGSLEMHRHDDFQADLVVFRTRHATPGTFRAPARRMLFLGGPLHGTWHTVEDSFQGPYKAMEWAAEVAPLARTIRELEALPTKETNYWRKSAAIGGEEPMRRTMFVAEGMEESEMLDRLKSTLLEQWVGADPE